MRSEDARTVHRKIMPTELIREQVRIKTASGTLAGELTYPFGHTSFAALIVNPHPHMGGHTGNSLLVRLADTMAGDGSAVLSFDYAGVGESDGPRIDVAASMSQFWQTGAAPEDPRLTDDTRHAVAWMTEATCRADSASLPPPLILVGYSFGAYAATMALTDTVGALVLISPTVRQHDFSPLRERTIAKLIVHSDNDFATPQPDLEDWMAGLPQPLETCCIPSGDHFYRGHEDAVASVCLAFARKTEPRPSGSGTRSPPNRTATVRERQQGNGSKAVTAG